MARLLKVGFAVLALGALGLALVIGLLYLVALAAGGAAATRLIAVTTTLQSIAIYTASLATLLALGYLYVARDHHLRMDRRERS